MARPKLCRRLSSPPPVKGFLPYGWGAKEGNPVELALEEYEALKICDYEGLGQEEGARRMGVSRPTYTRVYEEARRKVAVAFVEGRPLVIQGGKVRYESAWYHCHRCMSNFSSPEESVSCPQCGSLEPEPLEHCLFQGCGRCHKCKADRGICSSYSGEEPGDHREHGKEKS